MSPRTAVRALAITAVTGLGLTALAAPAHAADSNTITLEGPLTNEGEVWTGGSFVPADPADQPPAVEGSSVTLRVTATGLPDNGVFVIASERGVLTTEGGLDCRSTPTCSVDVGTGVRFLIQPGASNAIVRLEVRGVGNTVLGNDGVTDTAFTVTNSASPTPDPDPTPSPPSPGGSSTPTAPIYDLTFDPMETDATCSVAGVSAPRGTWVTVEAASGCVAPRTNPDATLLGWATDPDFSVEIAQRQIDNGWGAYETFDSDGELTGVFIPAGGTTLLTSPRNLHAIWSS